MTQVSKPPNKSSLRLLIGLTLVVALASLVYLASYLANQQNKDVHWVLPSACEILTTNCLVQLNDQQQLVIFPLAEEPQPLASLPFKIQLIGFSEAALNQLQLEVDLQGVDMYMGYNRTPMQHLGEGVFVATPSLSLCTEDKMLWRASFLLTSLTEEFKPLGTYIEFLVIN